MSIGVSEDKRVQSSNYLYLAALNVLVSRRHLKEGLERKELIRSSQFFIFLELLFMGAAPRV